MFIASLALGLTIGLVLHINQINAMAKQAKAAVKMLVWAFAGK